MNNEASFLIDFTELKNSLDIKKNDIEEACLDVGRTLSTIFVEKLIENVESDLNRSAQDYIDAIRINESSNVISVKLDSSSTIANALESGSDPYDMKPYFLNSSKVKYSKEGVKYMTVPLKWATTSSKGVGKGFANKMSRSVYDEVRKQGSISSNSKHSKKIFSRNPIVNAEGEVLYKEYKHKASVTQGIKKIPQGGNRSSYYSFRTISENSDPNAFIHKGFQAHNFFEKTLQELDIERLASQAFNREIL